MNCIQIKEDGTKCGAHPMRGSQFCFLHNPATKAERANAQARGAHTTKKLLKPLAPVRIQKTGDIITLLQGTLNEVRSGKMQPRIANCVGYLCGIILKTFETATLEEKVTKLEQAMQDQKWTKS